MQQNEGSLALNLHTNHRLNLYHNFDLINFHAMALIISQEERQLV